MDWKCCRLKFSNVVFLIATDGESLRIRGSESVQGECELRDCDSSDIKEIDMVQDEIILQRREMKEEVV